MSKDLLKVAGDFAQEVEEASLEKIVGGADMAARGLSKGNTGDYCTLTWELQYLPDSKRAGVKSEMGRIKYSLFIK